MDSQKLDYRVVSPVEHDGERFEEGMQIALDPKHAEPLLAVRAIAVIGVSESEGEKESQRDGGDE